MYGETRQKQYESFHKKTARQHSLIQPNNFTYRIILDVIETYLTAPKKILDIGCGAGTLSLYLANKGHTVLGIDISEKAIEACKKSAAYLGLNKQVSFRVTRFPEEVPHETFDVVICSEVLEHIADDKKALAKIVALLKQRGVVIFSTPSKNAPLHRLGYARGFDRRVGHVRRYALDELVAKCKNLGLEIVATKKTEGILRNFFFLNPIAGTFIRFFKYTISDIVTYIDIISLKLFGESQIFVIARKPS